MRKLLILGLLLSCSLVYSQRLKQLTDVTVDEVETLNSDVITISGGAATLSVDILCTEVSGTTDGNIQIEVRNGVGGNWLKVGEYQSSEFLTITGTGTGLQDSVLTMNAADVFHIVFNPAPFYEYRFNVTGTASDETTVSFDYLINYTR